MIATDAGTVYEDRKFEMLDDLELPAEVASVSFRNCWFFACAFGMTASDPSDRRHVRKVSIYHCKATNNTSIGPAVLDDVCVQGLRTAGLCIAWGTAFRRVRIAGRCGRFMLTGLPTTSNPIEKLARFKAANEEIYRGTDWALDISEGEFDELDIRSVPAKLIRRDPETQVVVQRERVEALQDVWRGLDLSGTPWRTALENTLAWGLEDRVLVAPKHGNNSRAWLAGLKLLRREGIADPA